MIILEKELEETEITLIDDYFRVSLTMTRQKLGDLRDSLVSSVWKTKFKKALNTYPEFDLVSLDFPVPHCDACNKWYHGACERLTSEQVHKCVTCHLLWNATVDASAYSCTDQLQYVSTNIYVDRW